MKLQQKTLCLLILIMVNSESVNGIAELLLNRATPWLERESLAKSFHLSSKISLLSLDSALQLNTTGTILHSTNFDGQNELNSSCAIHLLYIIEKLRKNRGDVSLSAFIDSFAKLPSGIMNGNLNWHGNQIQCESASVSIRSDSQSTFGGKFCMAQWNTKLSSGLPLRHSTGICVPSTCSGKDFGLMKDFLEKFFFLKITEQSKVVEISCGAENKITTDLIVFYSIISSLIILGISSTICDRYFLHTRKMEGNLNLSILSIFSIPRNLQSLNGRRVSKNDILIIHYLRGLSIILIIIGHCGGKLFETYILSPKSVANSIDKSHIFWLIPRILMTVFFFLSGFLIQSNNCNASQNFYPFQMVFKAFLRFSPSYYFVILAHTSFISTIGHGIKLDIGGFMSDRNQCSKVLWEHLIYYHNSLPSAEKCNAVFWSLAVTFQLYVVGVFIVWFILRSPITGLISGILLMVYGLASSVGAMYGAKLDHLIGLRKFSVDYRYLEGSLSNTVSYLSLFYTQTSSWLCPSIMGIFFAYLLPKLQRASYRLRKTATKSISISIVIFYAIFGLVASLKQSYLTYSLLQTFSPVGMGLILSILIFIFHPQSQLIGHRLSPETCPILVHFSRLSYPLYLTHWTVLVYILNTTSITPMLDKFTALCIMIGCLVLVYIVSILLYIFGEKPLQRLRKIFHEV